MAVPYDTLSNVHRIKSIVVNALFEELYAGIGGASAQARNQQSQTAQSKQGQAQTKSRWKL